MTLQELNQLVALGEGLTLEFKRRVPRPERIAKEVIAFANTRGGRLLLGVDDSGTIVGVRDPDEEVFALRQALRRCATPPIAFTMERIAVEHRREVIVVTIEESARKPHFLRNGRHRQAYIRVEDRSIEASPEVLALMRAEKHPRNVVFTFGEKELLLMRYLEHYGRITVQQFAQLANLSRRQASRTLVLLTEANVLRLHPDEPHDYFTLAYSDSPSTA